VVTNEEKGEEKRQKRKDKRQKRKEKGERITQWRRVNRDARRRGRRAEDEEVYSRQLRLKAEKRQRKSFTQRTTEGAEDTEKRAR
jgi:hypothetical protein